MKAVSTNGLVYCVDAFNIKSYPSGATYTAPFTGAVDNMGPARDWTGASYSLIANSVGFDGRSFTFDGVDDYIAAGDLSFLGTDFSSFTLNIWFNSSSITDYKNLIDFNGFNTCIRIEQYTAPGYFAAWSNLGGPSGYTRMSVSINGSGDSLGIGGDLPGTLTEDTWNNIILTYESSTQKVNLFLNGVKLVDQYTCGAPFVGYISDMRIGDGYDYSTRRFQGKIAYVALYTRPISDSESYQNYDTLKWRFI